MKTKASWWMAVGVLGLMILSTGCSTPKQRPLYLREGFNPQDVGVITVLQPLDLRRDKSLETDYVDILGDRIPGVIKKRKYKVDKNRDPALVAHVREQDLDNPTAEWIRDLGPSDAEWVLLTSVEYVTRFTTADSEAIAEVKGVLFDKNAGNVAWRGVGKGFLHAGLLLGGLADNDAVRMAAFNLSFSLPRKGDNVEDYLMEPDAAVPLTYNRPTLPKAGMTKEEIEGLFGPTEKIERHDKGETWYYHFNLGGAFIPFAAASYAPDVWVFNFDNEGRLSKYHFTDKRITGTR